MMIEISIQNGISKYLQSLIRNSPDFVRGCSKSMGYFVQREIKSELRKGGGDFKSSWPKRIPWRVRNDLRPGAPQRWYGRLINAIGYQYVSGGLVKVGWTSAASAKYGRIQEEGATYPVTAWVRKRWGKAGHPLRGGTTHLKVPARPFFEPIMNKLEPKLPAYVTAKAQEFLDNGGSFRKKTGKGRKDQVFGG